MKIANICESVGEASQTRPYYPYHAASARGLLPLELNQPSNQSPPGVAIAAGYIPYAKQAGIFTHNNERLAFDHVHLAVDGDSILIRPTSKDEVDANGQIRGEGAIVIARESGRLTIAAFAIDVGHHPSRLDAFRREGFIFMNRVGHIALISAALMEIPEYEITDIDTEAGILRAVPRIPQVNLE